MNRPLSLLFVLLLGACGAKTGLNVPFVDAGPEEDGFVPIDAPLRDAPPIDGFVPPPPPDVCIELPPDEPPEFVDVAFVARISTADVLFLVDVTGSMTEEIGQIQRGLNDVISPALIEEISDVQLSVAEFADYPVSPYGDTSNDIPFRLLQRSTASLPEAQAGVNSLSFLSGSDVPESHTEALFQVATGAGLPSFRVPGRRCPDGTVGAPCFRGEGTPIILLFTDAAFHNGPGGSEPYMGIAPPPAVYEDAVTALRSIGAKVLGLYSGGSFGPGTPPAVRDLEQIARDTGAVTEDGSPIVVDIGTSGERLDRGVIDVVRQLVDETPINIDAITEDYPGDDYDAREFVTGIVTTGATPASGADDLGDRYERVRPGTRVGLRVMLANDTIMRGEEPIVYFLTIILRGDGVNNLKSTVVQIVIPSIRGEGCDALVP